MRRLPIALAVLFALLAAGWLAAPKAAQYALSALAPQVQASIRSVGPTRAVVEDLRMDGIAAERIELSYSPFGLLARRIEAVTLTGLKVTALPAPGDSGEGGGWSVGRLAVEQAELALAQGGWQAAGTVSGTLELDVNAVRRLDLPHIDLTFSFDQPAQAAQVTARGSDKDLSLSVEVPRSYSAGFSAEKVALATRGRLTVADGHLRYELGEPGRLRAGKASVPGLLALTKPLEAMVQPTVLVDAAPDDGGWQVRADFALAQARLAARIDTEGDDPRLTLDIGSLRLGGVWRSADGSFRPVALLQDGKATLPGGMRLDALALSAVEAHDSQIPQVTVTAKLLDAVSPARVVPLGFEARLQPEGGAVKFSAKLADAGGRLDLGLTGQYGFGGGSAEFHLRPLTFGPALQPAALFPALAGKAEDASGTMAAKGSFRWGFGGVASKGEVLLRDLSGSLWGVRLRRLNSVVALDSLAPLATAPRQEASAALIEAGLPLTNALVQFAYRGGVLQLGGGHLTLAKGKVTLKDSRIAPSATRQRLWLDVTGVDLGTLVSQIALDGLDATGRLDGTIPLELDGGQLRVAGATLAATGAGALRYKPTQPPAALTGGGPADLLLQALGDFRYQKLSLGLDGQADEQIVAKLSVSGANPAFYDGYPVELNLTVSGRLGAILTDALTGYRIPDKIAERLAGFETAAQ